MADAYVAIFCMAAATFATRAAGPWVMQRLTVPKRVNVALEYLPGTLLISLVAAEISKMQMVEWPAVIAAAIVGYVSKNVLLTIVVGVVSVYFLRRYGAA